MDNAGKDGRRVQLHQDGKEDVRKFVPIWPVLAVFSAKKAYQTIVLGVVSVGKGLRDPPPVLIDSNTRLRGQGSSRWGKWHFRETSAWQKLFPQR